MLKKQWFLLLALLLAAGGARAQGTAPTTPLLRSLSLTFDTVRYSLGDQMLTVAGEPRLYFYYHNDDQVAELLRTWSGPDWTQTAYFAEAVDRYRAGARIPQAAYGSMEYFRWAGRSQLRPDGLRYARRMSAPISAPTLQLHGALDTCVLPETARGSGRYVAGAYEWRELPGVGHFPHEEAPAAVTAAIRDWSHRS